jgi:serine/threonine-protein phosphatase 2A regulatory subunit B'
VQDFLELFDSEETVERDYLKNILHKLYAKVSQKLALILSEVGASPKNDQKGD